MKTIQPGHEVLSLFGMTSQKLALTDAKSNGLASTVVSAFLIVLILGAMLSFAQRALTQTKTAALATGSIEEVVAFVPGQFVTKKINQGYLGN